MSRFRYLLFDADNTLFCFDEANRHAVQTLCETFSLPFSDELFHCYERHNNAAWLKLDRGEATKDEILLERFRTFFAETGYPVAPEDANRVLVDTLAQCVFMMPHAVDVVRTLHETHRLFLITNAVARVQESRLARSPLAPYIEAAFISETAGAAKPSRAYFDYVFAHIDGITHENALVIGDSLSSDMMGANNYDLPCCWFNPKRRENTEHLRVDWEITDLRELYEIV